MVPRSRYRALGGSKSPGNARFGGLKGRKVPNSKVLRKDDAIRGYIPEASSHIVGADRVFFLMRQERIRCKLHFQLSLAAAPASDYCFSVLW